MKNRYFIRSRISEKKFRQIIKFFSMDLTALQIASLTKVNRNTINNILKKIREKIAQHCEKENYFNKKEFAQDKLCVGIKCIHKTEDKDDKGKIIIFGLQKENGKTYIQVIKSFKDSTLSLIKEKLFHSDSFKPYNDFVDTTYKKLYKFYHFSNDLIAETGIKNQIKTHINGVKNFLGIAKVRLSKFRGINKNTFYLHLKECEFRFNNRDKNLYRIILDILRKEPLN